MPASLLKAPGLLDTLVLGNDLRAEAVIPYLIDFVLGDAGVPWTWEYGDAKSGSRTDR